MKKSVILLAPLAALTLSGCVASTLVGVATAPVRAASQAADWATTSQDEADRDRGREIRRREERLGELGGDYEEAEQNCLEGDDAACREAVSIRNEMEELRQTLPLEPDD